MKCYNLDAYQAKKCKQEKSRFDSVQARLQEIPSGSIYKDLSKNIAKLALFLDIFSSAIMDDLSMTFTSRLEVTFTSRLELATEGMCTIEKRIFS